MIEGIATYTEAEYLAIEERSEVRHEFVGGRLYQMSGGTERHELAVAALARRLYPGARAAGCRTFANRQLRVPSGDHFYPDVMVACGKASNLLYEERPTLIVEMLSPSTAAEDRKGIQAGRFDDCCLPEEGVGFGDHAHKVVTGRPNGTRVVDSSGVTINRSSITCWRGPRAASTAK